jgi:hypothetical protein
MTSLCNIRRNAFYFLNDSSIFYSFNFCRVQIVVTNFHLFSSVSVPASNTPHCEILLLNIAYMLSTSTSGSFH